MPSSLLDIRGTYLHCRSGNLRYYKRTALCQQGQVAYSGRSCYSTGKGFSARNIRKSRSNQNIVGSYSHDREGGGLYVEDTNSMNKQVAQSLANSNNGENNSKDHEEKEEEEEEKVNEKYGGESGNPDMLMVGKLSMGKVPEEKKKFEVPFKLGDIVVGEIIRKVSSGSTVKLLDFPGYSGYLPSKSNPFSLMNEKFSRSVNPRFRTVEPGLIREFKIIKMSDDIAPFKRGPLLSAFDLDIEMMWKRMSQAKDLSAHQHENMSSYILAQNSGGLMVSLLGHSAFLPKSHMTKELYQKACKDCLSDDYFYTKIKGMEISVCPESMEPARSRMVVSETAAKKNSIIRSLRIGALVTGYIRKVEVYGVFVGIEDTGVSGLLHVSNISQYLVKDVGEIFSVGEEIKAIILDMEEDYTRISFSTADLEQTPGDMLTNKNKVFENAPEMARAIQREIEAQRKQYYKDAES